MRPGAECGIRGPEGKAGRPGFTLLEVMAAVAILALVLVTLLGLRNRSMQSAMLADHMTVATMLADRLMLETVSSRPAPGEDEGGFEEEVFRAYAWRKVIAPASLPGIIEVRVAVLWQEADRDEMVELVSYE